MCIAFVTLMIVVISSPVSIIPNLFSFSIAVSAAVILSLEEFMHLGTYLISSWL